MLLEVFPTDLAAKDVSNTGSDRTWKTVGLSSITSNSQVLPVQLFPMFSDARLGPFWSGLGNGFPLLEVTGLKSEMVGSAATSIGRK